MRVLRFGAALVVLGVVSTACGSGGVAGQAAPVVTAQPSSAPPPTSTSRAAVAPTVGTTLQRLSGNDIHVIGSERGFTAVDVAQSAITAYDVAGTQLAQLPSDGFTVDCGAADVVTPAGRVVITALITKKEAEGVNPAQYALELDAWDPRTGQRAWQSPVVPSQTDVLECGYTDGEMHNFGVTRDGKWGVYLARKGGSDAPQVVDLATGEARAMPKVTGVLGNYLASYDGRGASKIGMRILDPASGAELKAVPALNEQHGVHFADSVYAASTPVFAVAAGVIAPEVGLTPDGSTAVAYPRAPNEDPITAYHLPDMKPLWTVPSDQYGILADSGGVALFGLHAPDSAADNKLVAFDDKTGERKWDVPLGEICGLSGTQLLLAVHDQLAVIDLATGKQVSFTDSASDCPTVLPGGVTVTVTEDGGLTVAQTLTP